MFTKITSGISKLSSVFDREIRLGLKIQGGDSVSAHRVKKKNETSQRITAIAILNKAEEGTVN